MGSRLSESFDQAKSFVLGREEPEPQGWLSMFNFLPNDKSYTNAGISFAIAAFFLLLAFFLLATIVLMPAKFVMCFTLGMLGLLVGLAFLNGPRTYVKKLFVKENLPASIFLIVSLVLSLWFSLIHASYIFSIIFCICQLNAILYFFCKTSPIKMSTVTWLGRSMCEKLFGGSK